MCGYLGGIWKIEVHARRLERGTASGGSIEIVILLLGSNLRNIEVFVDGRQRKRTAANPIRAEHEKPLEQL
jgi:hypothetical protein